MKAEVFGLGSSEESRVNIPVESPQEVIATRETGERKLKLLGGGDYVRKDSSGVCWLGKSEDVEFVRLHWPAKLFSLVRSTLQPSVHTVRETKSSVHQG